MGQILIRCPRTGSQISVGMIADRQAFKALPATGDTVHCPVCDGFHSWTKREAIFVPFADPPAEIPMRLAS